MNRSNKVRTSDITNGIINLIKNNIIARTNLSSDANVGDVNLTVDNAFQFKRGNEIVLIDDGYNDSNAPHYQQLEYAVIKRVDDVHTIVLERPLLGQWLTSQAAAVQKTIAHTPLFPNNILYGDRDVIPTDEVAVTVEVTSLSNEWIYLQGGLSEDYKARIMVYGKSVESEEGRLILDAYSDAIYTLLNENIHIDINNIETPILQDIAVDDDKIYIEKTEENLENFIRLTPTSGLVNKFQKDYVLQDAQTLTAPCQFFDIINVDENFGIVGGKEAIELTTHETILDSFSVGNYAYLIRWMTYFYDSRVDSVNFGQVYKGSAVLRAAEINWFGKTINEHSFPQKTYGVPYMPNN